MDLKTYLLAMPVAEREAFAKRCRTSWPHLRNIIYGRSPCSEKLALEIERETCRAVVVETLCPDADWSVVRSTALSPSA